MSFRNSLFRDPFWGYGKHEVFVHRLSDLYTPFNDAEDDTQGPEPGSRFSSDSEEIPIGLGPPSNLLSPLSQLAEKRRAWDEKALPPIPLTSYTIPRRVQVCEATPHIGFAAVKEYAYPRPMSRRPTQTKRRSPRPPRMSRSREAIFVTTICLAHLCAYAGIGQVLPILRIIGMSFRISNVSHLSWAVAGYTMIVGTFIPVAGRLAEIYGYKRVFLTGIVWCAVWSAVAGASFYSGATLFIISRVFQGLGIALSLPAGLSLLGASHSTGKRKAAIFTLVAAMAPIGLIVGALVASALTLSWWPLAYWAFTLTLFVIACFGAVTIPKAVQTNKLKTTIGTSVGDLDLPGIITGTSSLVLFGFAWVQGATVGWQQSYVWMALIISVLLAVVFVLIESQYATKPLVPFSVFPTEVALILTGVACGWSSFGIWVFYTWQIAQGFRKASPLLSTAYFCPIVIIGSLAAVTTGLTLHRLGPSLTMAVSLLAFTGGSLLIVTMPVTQVYWAQMFVGIIVTAWGMNTCMPAATLMLSNAVEKRYHSVTGNLVNAVTFYSIGIGLGVAATVESKVDNKGLSNLNGYRAALWTGVGFAGLGLITCLGLLLTFSRQRQSHR